MRVLLQNFRSFVQPAWLELREMTLIVGENSSGKSTAMAGIAAVMSSTFPDPSVFNAPPFHLGGFHTIWSGVGEPKFKIAYENVRGPESTSKIATFGLVNEEIQVVKLDVRGKFFTLEVDVKNNRATGTLRIVGSRGRPFTIDTRLPPRSGFAGSASPLQDIVYYSATRKLFTRLEKSERYRRAIHELRLLMRGDRPSNEIRTIAPLRTAPDRTYDQTSDAFDPTGSHIPKVLNKIFADQGTQATKLKKTLREFGKLTGLFEDVYVRRSDEMGGAFQIEVSVSGSSRNLIDVGYGVSQSLPVAVETIVAPNRTRFLIQQPEVHLHPRAQAGLASLLVSLVSAQSKQFVIETHSDYVVDRVRQEIKNGNISHSSVSLIFLERNKHETVAHQIELDKSGDPKNPPASYRDFFVKEMMEML